MTEVDDGMTDGSKGQGDGVSHDPIVIDIDALHEDLKDFAVEYDRGRSSTLDTQIGVRVSSAMFHELKKVRYERDIPIQTMVLIGLRWVLAHIGEIDDARVGIELFGNRWDR